MTRVRHSAARVTIVALAATVVLACSAIGRPSAVEGWRIGPEIDCAGLSLPLERCQALQRRAVAYAEGTGGPVSSWTMHAAEQVNDEGQPALLASGTGMPDAILLVRQRDGYHAALVGCTQPAAPNERAEDACP